MKEGIFLLVLIIAAAGTVAFTFAAAEDSYVTFEDERIEMVVREQLQQSEGELKLGDVRGIEELDLQDRGIHSLAGLEKLINLKKLDLGGNRVSDLTPLKELTYLENLDISSNAVTDLSALAELSTLTSLDVGDNQVKDISAIKNLTHITQLDISNNQITDLSPLADFNQLTELEAGFNQISDISVLEEMTLLETLNLENNQVSDLAAISGLVSLSDLKLQNNQVSDLTALSDLVKLLKLDLQSNEIADLEPISGMNQLTSLDLQDNKLAGIKPLQSLEMLRTLDLRDNQIEDIAVLAQLNNLEAIDLRNNQVRDFSAITDLPYLTEQLLVKGNPISDYSPFLPLYEKVTEIDIADPALSVVFSQAGGFYEGSQQLTIEPLTETEGTIRYTLDGSEPDQNSAAYSGPVTVSNTLVLKARLFDQHGRIGPITTATYFIGEDTTIPVVSISMKDSDLFGASQGIYAEGPDYNPSARNPVATANYGKSGIDWERPAHIEIYQPDGTRVINQTAGIRIHGNATRKYPKKSFRIYARSEYGLETFNYALFGEEGLDKYERVVIRNSGNDWSRTLFRDAYLQSLVSELDLETQAAQPAHLYLNGQYWGLYNLRERIDDNFLEEKYDIASENLEHLEDSDADINKGDNKHFLDMIDYMESHEIEKEEVYEEVASRMDISNYIDYTITEIYVRNTDWPDNNIRYFREKPDGKWRWTVFDLDHGFSELGDSRTVSHHMMNYATGSNRLAEQELANGSTFLLRTLLENEAFRNEFAGRFSHYLNTIFDEEKIHSKLAEFEAIYEPEIMRNTTRWDDPDDMEEWKNDVQEMRDFGAVRDDFVFAHLMDYFRLPGYADFAFEMEDGHQVSMYHTEIPVDDGTWKGRYLMGIPVEIMVDGAPAKLVAADGEVVSVTEEGKLTAKEAGEAIIEIQTADGETAGQLSVSAEEVPHGERTVSPGQSLNWQSEIGEGAYATVSNPMLGSIQGSVFRAEANGAVLVTVHDENDQVTAMERITIE